MPTASTMCQATKNDTGVLAPPSSGTGVPSGAVRIPEGKDRMKPTMSTVMLENVPPSTR